MKQLTSIYIYIVTPDIKIASGCFKLVSFFFHLVLNTEYIVLLISIYSYYNLFKLFLQFSKMQVKI